MIIVSELWSQFISQHKVKYIRAVWREWRESDDGNWYLKHAEVIALRIKATICIVLGLRKAADWQADAFGVGMVDFDGPYTDYYNGGNQATWTQIDVARWWSEWWYTDYTNAWQ